MSVFSVLAGKITLDNAEFVAAMNKAREASSRAIETFKGVALGVTGLGATFAGFRGAENFAEGIRDAIETGRQLVVQARQMSTNVASVVQLRKAFQDAGVDAGEAGTAVFMLQKALGGVSEEGVPTSTAFARIGISIADLKKLNPVEQFRAIANGLQRLLDSASRADVSMKIFGRGARDLQAILADPKGFNESIQSSQRYAQVMERNGATFERVSKTIEDIQYQAKAFYASVAEGVAPALQQVLNLLQKIDLSSIGESLGRGISLVVQAISSGKIFDVIGQSIIITFKQAVNVVTGLIYGLAGAFQAEFMAIPRLLRDAFGMITDVTFWKGVGELLLGSIQSVQGRLVQIMINVADALGSRIADVLEKIPGFKAIVESLRGTLSRGSSIASSVNQQLTKQGDSLTASGAADIANAGKPIVRDYVKMIKDEIQAAISGYNNNKAFSTGDNVKSLLSDLSSIVAGVKASIPTGDSNKSGAPSAQNRAAITLKPETNFDRLAKVGLFVGGAVQTPGLAEAKRTANATEKALKTLDTLVNVMKPLSNNKGTVYAE